MVHGSFQKLGIRHQRTRLGEEHGRGSGPLLAVGVATASRHVKQPPGHSWAGGPFFSRPAQTDATLSLVPHGMIAHLPRAPRRHPTQRSESCGSTESLRLYARRVIQLEGGHSRTFTIVRSQPAIQSPVREARPPRAMVRIQPKRWSDHCQSAAHIKSAGGCGRIRTLRPPHPHSLASASPCMYLWCAYLEAFRT